MSSPALLAMGAWLPGPVHVDFGPDAGPPRLFAARPPPAAQRPPEVTVAGPPPPRDWMMPALAPRPPAWASALTQPLWGSVGASPTDAVGLDPYGIFPRVGPDIVTDPRAPTR